MEAATAAEAAETSSAVVVASTMVEMMEAVAAANAAASAHIVAISVVAAVQARKSFLPPTSVEVSLSSPNFTFRVLTSTGRGIKTSITALDPLKIVHFFDLSVGIAYIEQGQNHGTTIILDRVSYSAPIHLCRVILSHMMNPTVVSLHLTLLRFLDVCPCLVLTSLGVY